MTNVNLSRVGESNANNDPRALLLKTFTGEVYESFRNNLIAANLIRKHNLVNAKEKQFIHTGTVSAGYHTPGTPLLGQADEPLQAETTITTDAILKSSVFLYELDEVLAHYSTRGPISRQMGYALAQHYDRRILRVLDQASGAAAPVTGEPGGFQINLGVGNEYNAQAIVDGFFEAAAILDERSAPETGRGCILTPRQYYSLISSVDTNILNRDVGNTQGNMNTGDGLYSIAGIKIYKSNNVPFLGKYGSATGTTIEDADSTNEFNPYGDGTDFTNSCGIIFHQDAAACVSAIAPTVRTTGAEFRTQYLGDLIVAHTAMGAKAVRVSVAGAFRNVA